MPKLDLLTIGDCSIDLFMRVPDGAAGVEETGKYELARMCFFHGSKIMVDGFSTSISGNSVNVSVGVEMLGLNTGIYSETGDDINAERLARELKVHSVDTSLLIKNANTETALHAVIVFSGERTIFSYHGKRNYKIRDWGKPRFIYYTSIGEGFESFQKELAEYIKKNNDIGLVVNPGTFQMAKGIDSLKNIFAVTDILIVNKEEAETLTKMPTGTDVSDLHKKLHDFGAKLTAITDGDNGATAYDGSKLHAQKIYSDDRPVVDKTGAGDAFSAGFLAALIYGKKLDEALKWGVINSGSQIKVVGSIDGMLTKSKLEKLLPAV